MGAGGYTLQSKAGLSVPTTHLESKETNALKKGSLKKFQESFNWEGMVHQDGRRLIAVVVDEYSMVSATQLYWVHHRLQEATASTHEFGGVCIALFGDPGQLPPVGGTSLWRSERDNTKSAISGLCKAGHDLYMAIQTVMELNVVRRQSGHYRDALMRLRDGKTTPEDWKDFWNKNCSFEGIGQQRSDEFKQDPSTLRIYSNNEDCKRENKKALKQLNHPIMRIQAEHDGLPRKRSSDKSAEACGELENTLYISKESKVMLRRNLATQCGLVNGSVGFVKEIVYENEHDPRKFSLPIAVIVEFESYTGAPFFHGDSRRKWVPLRPQKQDINRSEETYRRQFSICLAYAITGHKSQGMTIRGKVLIEIGDKEATSGLLYVMTSRNTDIQNLCIGKSKPFERWSKNVQTKGLEKRLKEDERLRELASETRDFFGVDSR